MNTVSIRDLRKSIARIVLDTPPPAEKPDFKARFGPGAKIKPVGTKSGTPLQDFLRWRDEQR